MAGHGRKPPHAADAVVGRMQQTRRLGSPPYLECPQQTRQRSIACGDCGYPAGVRCAVQQSAILTNRKLAQRGPRGGGGGVQVGQSTWQHASTCHGKVGRGAGSCHGTQFKDKACGSMPLPAMGIGGGGGGFAAGYGSDAKAKCMAACLGLR
eukprot:365895-Chlamydomonas_euryale.AAC.3